MVQFPVQPIRMRIRGASEVIDPHRRIHNCHVRKLLPHPAQTGLIQVSFPLHLAAELADCGLRVRLHQQLQRGLHYGPFGASAAAAHCTLDQLVVKFNVCPHRNSSMCKNPTFMCIVSSVESFFSCTADRWCWCPIQAVFWLEWGNVRSKLTGRVPLDKDEGFVKAQSSCAVRLHRMNCQGG